MIGSDIFILLDPARDPLANATWLEAPAAIIRADAPDEVDDCLAALADATAKGLTAAGFFAYELGYVLEPRLRPLLPPPTRGLPLLWLGLFARPVAVPGGEVDAWLGQRCRGDWRLGAPAPALDREAYRAKFRRVQDYIAAGDAYQINLTFPYKFNFDGDPIAFYRFLRRNQRVAHGALIVTPDFRVLSLSPELFLRIDNGEAHVRPMKGTARRGVTAAEDEELKAWLRSDEKSRAENVMIVDLLRNDLSRISAIGSVAVSDLYSVETYRTLHQMTSGIGARLRPGVSLAETLRALFPSGSVTGAPKIRAMQIIRELEDGPRGVYTGAIGQITPNGRLFLNVAIRTILLTPAPGGGAEGELAVGSGLVADSVADAEYDECRLKARFLTQPAPDFQLIETFRWQRASGYYLLPRHLARLANSAAYFGFPCHRQALLSRLATAVAQFTDDTRRVRLTLDANGVITVESEPLLLPHPTPVRYALSEVAVSPADPFLYHKTTRRELYQRELARLSRWTGCDEVIFINDRGEVTEGTWTTVFVGRGNWLLTPPLRCGLLDGTLRRELLEGEDRRVTEAILHPSDLATADRVLVGNAVRGLMPAMPV